MINGVILKKLQALDDRLNELDSLGKVTIERLNNDWQIKRAIECNLQMMMAIFIDVCKGSLPQLMQAQAATATKVIELCVQSRVLSNQESYRPIVDFHNVFVRHCYEKINANTLTNFMNNHLDDFRRFRDEVLTHARDHN